MNLKTLVFALVFLVTSRAIHAADGRSYEFIKTNSGKVYNHCRVFKTDPDGVIISHQHGGAKLLFADLAPDARAMLGYDEKKEAEYLKGRADAAAKEREQLWSYRKEVAKAQAAAYAAVAKRLEVINMQMGGFPGYYGGLPGYGWWDGSLGYSPYGYNHVSRGLRNGYFGHQGLSRGRYTFPTPANAGNLNVIGRTHFPVPYRSQATPLGVPAMGAPPPALGAGAR